MTEYHDKRAIEILQTIKYATIATVSIDNTPWNTPVRFVYDDDFNIYWFSDKQNQHSQNVRNNENVSIVIYDSTVPEGKGEGVYIQAKAYELEDIDEIRAACVLHKGTSDKANDFTGGGIRRVYKAVPQKTWMNDAEIKNGVFIRDYRVEVSLITS